jgi:hypothetical protein
MCEDHEHKRMFQHERSRMLAAIGRSYLILLPQSLSLPLSIRTILNKIINLFISSGDLFKCTCPDYLLQMRKATAPWILKAAQCRKKSSNFYFNSSAAGAALYDTMKTNLSHSVLKLHYS